MFLCKSTQIYYFPFSWCNFLNPFSCVSYLTNPHNSLGLSAFQTPLCVFSQKEGAVLKSLCSSAVLNQAEHSGCMWLFNLPVHMIKGAENSRVFSQIPKTGRPTRLLASQWVALPWIWALIGVHLSFPKEDSLVTELLKDPIFVWIPPTPGSLEAPEATLYFQKELHNCGKVLSYIAEICPSVLSIHPPAFRSNQHKLLFGCRTAVYIPPFSFLLHLRTPVPSLRSPCQWFSHIFFKWNLTLI